MRYRASTPFMFMTTLFMAAACGPEEALLVEPEESTRSPAAVVTFPVKEDSFAQFSPDVAYDVGVDQYAVAFTDATEPNCGTNECTQNVTAVVHEGTAGAKLATKVVSATPGTDDKEPTVAANTTTGGYLVAYYIKDSSNPYCTHRVQGNVWAKIYDRAGNVTGPINVSATTGYHNVRVRAAYDPITKRYLLAWETASTQSICSAITAAGNNLGTGLARSPWRVRARILNANGTFHSGVFIPSNRSNTVQQNPDVAANTKSGGWMVTWGDKRFIDDNNNSRTEAAFGQLINSNLPAPYRVFTSWDLIIGDSSFQDRFPRVAYNTEDDQWVATWYGARGAFDEDRSGTIYAQRMQNDGYWLGCPGACPLNVYNPLTTGEGNGHPDIVYCPQADRYWIAWQIDGLTVRYKPFGRDLAALANSVGVSGVKAPAFAQTCRPSDGRTILVYESYNNDAGGDIRARFFP